MISKYSPKELDGMNVNELIKAVGLAWDNHDKDTFVSLFADDAIIDHVLFTEPITPAVAMDVLGVTANETVQLHNMNIIHR